MIAPRLKERALLESEKYHFHFGRLYSIVIISAVCDQNNLKLGNRIAIGKIISKLFSKLKSIKKCRCANGICKARSIELRRGSLLKLE